MIRVLVADDSSTVRTLITTILRADPAIEVVGEAINGRQAVELVAKLRPHVVTMDVNMPVLDGLDATKEIMATTPTPIVIVSSAARDPDVGLSLAAMGAGALLVLPPPRDPRDPAFEANRAEFVSMIRAMADVKVVRHRIRPLQPVEPVPVPHPGRAAAPIEILAIAASTGGPAALQRLLIELPRDFPVPTVVVQHIATGFVEGLCLWLNATCRLRVKVAEHGEALRPRMVYLAPDSRHLCIEHGVARLRDDAPIGGFRPSANYLFETAARSHGAGVAALILTGMGNDGVQGLRAVDRAGGHIVAQDEATSVVFGMPGEAIRAGLPDAVLPLERMAGYLSLLISESRNGV